MVETLDRFFGEWWSPRAPMHEYGMVESLLAEVDGQVRSHQGRRAVRVVVGIDGSHVDETFLRDAFDTFKATTAVAQDAELVVVTAPIEIWCSACEARVTVEGRQMLCPRCGGPGIHVTSADEIYLQSVEIEV